MFFQPMLLFHPVPLVKLGNLPACASIRDCRVYGTVYKPRRHLRGVAQISTLLNKSYLVKLSTKGEGGQKYPKFCLRGLYTAPNENLSKSCTHEDLILTKFRND